MSNNVSISVELYYPVIVDTSNVVNIWAAVANKKLFAEIVVAPIVSADITPFTVKLSCVCVEFNVAIVALPIFRFKLVGAVMLVSLTENVILGSKTSE